MIFSMFGCKTLPDTFIMNKVLWATAWSPDHNFVAVGGNQEKLKLYHAHDLSLFRELTIPNTITKIRWHPTENIIAVSRQLSGLNDSNDQSTLIINLDNDHVIQLDVEGARGLGWSHDGRHIAVGSVEGLLHIYTRTGRLIKTIETHQKSITALSWHPAKDMIVTVGSQIELVDLNKGRQKEIVPHDIEILMLSVAWHPSGEFFVTGDYGDFIVGYPPYLMFWKADGQLIKKVRKSKAEYRNLAWNSDGSRLVSASDKVRIWDSEGRLKKQQSFGNLLWGVDWSPDDVKIVMTTDDGQILFVDKDLNNLRSTNQ